MKSFLSIFILYMEKLLKFIKILLNGNKNFLQIERFIGLKGFV